MSSPDRMQLAHRVCAASKSICELISSRVPIKLLRSDNLIRSPETCAPHPNSTTTSLSVDDQTAHFARLDAISVEIDEWEGISPSANVTKSNSRTKRNVLEETNKSVDVPDEIMSATDIKAFNEQQFCSSVDVAKICDQDKQTFRPIFRHVPRLQEVVRQIEELVEVKKENTRESAKPEFTVLLEKLNQVIWSIQLFKNIFYIKNIH